MLGAAGVQIPENNLDDLHSSKRGDGTSEYGTPDLLGFLLIWLYQIFKSSLVTRGTSSELRSVVVMKQNSARMRLQTTSFVNEFKWFYLKEPPWKGFPDQSVCSLTQMLRFIAVLALFSILERLKADNTI
ncbi:hypothetical protein Tco_0987570 [Tanacetum coccineum]